MLIRLNDIVYTSGANVNWVTQTTRRSPLHAAAAAGHMNVVNMLLHNGLSNTVCDLWHWRCFDYYGLCFLPSMVGRQEGIQPEKQCWYIGMWFDWSFARPRVPVVTTNTNCLLVQQNPGWFDTRVPADLCYPGNWPLKWVSLYGLFILSLVSVRLQN